MPSNLYLLTYAIGKVLLTTGLGPAFVALGAWELICRAEQRAKRKKSLAVVIEFPGAAGGARLASRKYPELSRESGRACL